KKKKVSPESGIVFIVQEKQCRGELSVEDGNRSGAGGGKERKGRKGEKGKDGKRWGKKGSGGLRTSGSEKGRRRQRSQKRGHSRADRLMVPGSGGTGKKVGTTEGRHQRQPRQCELSPSV